MLPYIWLLKLPFFVFQIPQRMCLNKEQQIEIILGSSRMIAGNGFTRKHETNIINDTAAKFNGKLKKLRIVTDQTRCDRRRTANDEDTTAMILEALTRSPTKSIRKLSAKTDVSKSCVNRILKTNKWHPYKLQKVQHMGKDDPGRSIEFWDWVLSKLK